MTLFSLEHEKPNIKGDRLNIILLIFMYALQSIPRGFATAIPLILQNRKATYQDQAEFSLVSTTYSFKLLWAPIIDCVYSKKMGRRKSWVIPMQYVIGTLLLLVSFKVDFWLGSEDGSRRPRIHLLTIAFFLCILCSSIQDVAVDGWSLTMLQKRNVGHSGTCNSVGYAVSMFFGYVSFIMLDSKEFCNYFRTVPQDHGFVEFSSFMLFWSIVFMVSTTLIFAFKKDNSLDRIENDEECRLGLIGCYMRLWQIVKIEPIQKICLVLITCMIFFAPINGLANLKLMDAGVPRDKFVLLSLPSIPALLILPFLLSHFLTKHRALTSFLAVILFRLVFSFVYAAFISLTPRFKTANGAFPASYYGILLLISNVESVTDYAMWISATAYTSHIADPRFAAMYATLSNTMLQIGNKWSVTLSIRLVNLLTFKSCVEINNVKTCTVKLDGFYTEIAICSVAGFFWLYWARKQVMKLQKMDASAFRVKEKSTIVKSRLLQRSTLNYMNLKMATFEAKVPSCMAAENCEGHYKNSFC